MSLKSEKQEYSYIAVWPEELFVIWLLSVLATDYVKVMSIFLFHRRYHDSFPEPRFYDTDHITS